MNEATTQFFTQVPVKRLRRAEKILHKLGLTPADAVNMLLAQIEIRRGLPFEVSILWHKDLTDQLLHWIEVGQPDERRLAKACGRSRKVTLYCYSYSAHIWYAGIANKLSRLRNLEVWQLPSEQSQALAGLCKRSMQLQISIQDGHVYINQGDQAEVVPTPLWRGGA